MVNILNPFEKIKREEKSGEVIQNLISCLRIKTSLISINEMASYVNYLLTEDGTVCYHHNDKTESKHNIKTIIFKILMKTAVPSYVVSQSVFSFQAPIWYRSHIRNRSRPI